MKYLLLFLSIQLAYAQIDNKEKYIYRIYSSNTSTGEIVQTGVQIKKLGIVTSLHGVNNNSVFIFGRNSTNKDITLKIIAVDNKNDLVLLSYDNINPNEGFEIQNNINSTKETFSTAGFPASVNTLLNTEGLKITTSKPLSKITDLSTELEREIKASKVLDINTPVTIFNGSLGKGMSGAPVITNQGKVYSIVCCKINQDPSYAYFISIPISNGSFTSKINNYKNMSSKVVLSYGLVDIVPLPPPPPPDTPSVFTVIVKTSNQPKARSGEAISVIFKGTYGTCSSGALGTFIKNKKGYYEYIGRDNRNRSSYEVTCEKNIGKLKCITFRISEFDGQPDGGGGTINDWLLESFTILDKEKKAIYERSPNHWLGDAIGSFVERTYPENCDLN